MTDVKPEIGTLSRILALDTATTTGWAIGTDGPEQWGTVCFAKGDRAERWWGFHAWLCDMVDEHQPDLIAIEKPIFRGSGSVTLAGFLVQAELVAYARELGVVPVNVSTLKKHAGVAGALKPISTARERGWEVNNSHEADACWLHDYVATNMEKDAAA